MQLHLKRKIGFGRPTNHQITEKNIAIRLPADPLTPAPSAPPPHLEITRVHNLDHVAYIDGKSQSGFSCTGTAPLREVVGTETPRQTHGC